jgi:hypothetical protein
MSAYSNNLWAQEMNIDLDDLQRERPWDLEQLQNTRRIARKSAEYWARERLREAYEDRVEPYEFTETQLAIAVRSLNAEGSV